MFYQRLVILGAILSIGSGCRTTSNDRCERAIALLRAEKIDLENRYYELESRLASITGEEHYGGNSSYENFSPGQPLPGSQFNFDPSIQTEELPSPRERGNQNNDLDDEHSSVSEIPEIVIEGGDFSVPDRNLTANDRHSMTSQPTMDLPTPNRPSMSNRFRDKTLESRSQPSLTPVAPFDERQLASQISDVVVDYDMLGKRTPSSWLIVQPVDENRQAIPLSGEIVVSVINPDLAVEKQRIGLWKFDRQRTESWVRDRAGEVPGIHIPIPVNLRGQSTDGLIAFVRYTALDRQVYEVSFPLDKRILQANVAEQGERTAIRQTEPSVQDVDTEVQDSLEWSPRR